MNNTFEHDIERYLDGDMNDQEVKKFESRLASNKEFAHEFEKTHAAYQLVQLAGRKELMDTLESFEQDSLKSEIRPQKRAWLKPVVSVAATLIIFIVMYEFLFNKTEVTTDLLYDTYFTKYSNPSVIRNTQDTALVNWETAVQLYHDQKYQEAIPYFEEAEVPTYLSSFYAGLSLLQQEKPNYEASILKFDLVLQNDNDYLQQAYWYKGLALLKLEKLEDALTIFSEIVAKQSYQSDKAQEIMNQLKKE